MLLRWIVLVLALANGGIYAWSQGWLGNGDAAGNEREPQRLQHQVNAQRVQVKPLAPEGAAQAARRFCMEAGPLVDADVPAAEAALRDAGLEDGQWKRGSVDRPGTWLVYMGRLPDPELMARKQAELQRRGIAFETVRGAPDLEPGLSLGRFNDPAQAEEVLRSLTQRGVRTARVVTVQTALRMTTLRADTLTADALKTLKAQPAGRPFKACGAAG
jgi:hypothetical protein